MEFDPDLVIHPSAWRDWERSVMPGRLDEVVRAVLSQPEPLLRIERLLPSANPWSVEARLGEWRVTVIGERDAEGRWTRVLAVLPVREE